MRSIYKDNLSSWKSILDIFKSLDDAFSTLNKIKNRITWLNQVTIINLFSDKKMKLTQKQLDLDIVSEES
jgi:hypothetical protein